MAGTLPRGPLRAAWPGRKPAGCGAQAAEYEGQMIVETIRVQVLLFESQMRANVAEDLAQAGGAKRHAVELAIQEELELYEIQLRAKLFGASAVPTLSGSFSQPLVR